MAASELRALATACGVYVPTGDERFCDVLIQAGQVQGFACWDWVLDEGSLLGLAVAPNQRRQGRGAQLLQRGAAQLQSAGVRVIFLEVWTENAPALALYRAWGATPIGRRKNYYGSGKDAWVYQKII